MVKIVRDLRPSHILTSEDGKPYLNHFGALHTLTGQEIPENGTVRFVVFFCRLLIYVVLLRSRTFFSVRTFFNCLYNLRRAVTQASDSWSFGCFLLFLLQTNNERQVHSRLSLFL